MEVAAVTMHRCHVRRDHGIGPSIYLTGATIFADAGWTAIDGRFEPALKPSG